MIIKVSSNLISVLMTTFLKSPCLRYFDVFTSVIREMLNRILLNFFLGDVLIVKIEMIPITALFRQERVQSFQGFVVAYLSDIPRAASVTHFPQVQGAIRSHGVFDNCGVCVCLWVT